MKNHPVKQTVGNEVMFRVLGDAHEALRKREAELKEVSMELSAEEKDLILAHRKKKEREFKPSILSDVTIDEKIKYYDALHTYATSIWDQIKEEYYKDDDIDHYCYEQVMEILTPKNKTTGQLWDAINEMTEGG